MCVAPAVLGWALHCTQVREFDTLGYMARSFDDIAAAHAVQQGLGADDRAALLPTGGIDDAHRVLPPGGARPGSTVCTLGGGVDALKCMYMHVVSTIEVLSDNISDI